MTREEEEGKTSKNEKSKLCEMQAENRAISWLQDIISRDNEKQRSLMTVYVYLGNHYDVNSPEDDESSPWKKFDGWHDVIIKREED